MSEESTVQIPPADDAEPTHKDVESGPLVDNTFFDLYPDTPAVGAPLGPGSLTWKYFGETRSMFLLGRAGTLQNMHPVLDNALRRNSNFFDDPMDRFARSIGPIHSMIYSPDPIGWSHQVRDYHKRIKGTDDNQQPYHALRPDVYWWTHVTFVESIIASQEHFGTPLTREEKRQLIAEGVTWWRQYGMTEKPIIGDLETWDEYWKYMYESKLERNFTTDWGRKTKGKKNVTPPPPNFSPALWKLLNGPLMNFSNWITTGAMPPEAREILDWKWTKRDQILFKAFCKTVKVAWTIAPRRYKYLPISYKYMRMAENDPAQYPPERFFTAPERPA